MVLLDTCALLWYTLDPDKLSFMARKKCSEIPQKGACISSISLWEIGLKIKNGKLDIGVDIQTYLDILLTVKSITIIAVTEAVWLQNLALKWEHRDPADRTIVATAILKDVPIISADKVIQDFYRNTIWN